MLTHLDVRNYALIDRLSLDLAAGFTVLTGETGAGKSILIEALGLALGDRADAEVVRQGAERAEISATISLDDNEPARRWLVEQALDGEDDCILRRVVGADGRSKAFINDSPVPLASLRAFGSLLIDIHGQHEHHALLEREHQANLLDGYARHRPLVEKVAATCRKWRDVNEEAAETAELLGGSAGGQVELLRYQLSELTALRLTEGEWRRLGDEQRRLANAGQIIAACQAGIDTLRDGDDSVAGRVARLLQVLRQGSQVDPAFERAIQLIEGAAIQVDEAASELRDCLGRLDLDPDRLEEIDRRMTAIHDLARKHRVKPEDLPELERQIRERLESFTGAEARLAALRAEIAKLDGEYREAAGALTVSRRRAAESLSGEITREMRKLGMPEGRFVIELEPRTDTQPAASGQERALFMVSSNPQQTPRPLAKVASGGELSRIGLAVQMITAEQTAIPSVIFDEVDVGIGGRVAEIVGQCLRRLGSRRQVLCITHLPQVAALGHHHLQVEKSVKQKRAEVAVRPLSRGERKEELARMLGGIEISAKIRAHAEELIKRSEELAES